MTKGEMLIFRLPLKNFGLEWTMTREPIRVHGMPPNQEITTGPTRVSFTIQGKENIDEPLNTVTLLEEDALFRLREDLAIINKIGPGPHRGDTKEQENRLIEIVIREVEG